MPAKTNSQPKPAADKPAAKTARAAARPAPAKAAKPAKKTKAATAVRKPAPAAPAPAPKVPVVTAKRISADIAALHSLDGKFAAAVVAGVFASVVAHVRGGDRVKIAGLGTVGIRDLPARAGRNPATGEAIQVKASRKVAFRAAKELRHSI